MVAVKDGASKVLGSIKDKLKSLAKGVTVAVSVAGGAVLGGALNEGAKLQQSTGGVETLFKGDADKVIENANKQELIGTTTAVYFFCEGADHNQISLTDPEDIIRVRERIANDPDYIEISCNDEARMLGAGFSKPVGGRDHAKHIEELKRKYGGDEEPEYSEWDRSLISKIKQ